MKKRWWWCPDHLEVRSIIRRCRKQRRLAPVEVVARWQAIQSEEASRLWAHRRAKAAPPKDLYASQAWRRLRYSVLVKHAARCMCCGSGPPAVVLHVDHVRPVSKYPELALEESNLQVLCEACNMGKSNLDETDWRP